MPTIVVAGTGSGTGKTTVVCAMAAALAARSTDVRLFKAGPDYLDPTFHQAVIGRPSRNLDAWMTGASGVSETFSRGVADLATPGIAIVEGVMGLFDGRSPTGLEGSGAELAQTFGAPVVLIVDAGGMARSAVAIVEGFANHADGVRVAGVVFNRVGSARHLELLEEALALANTREPVVCLGGLPKNDTVFLPSRHLGLLAARVSPATASEPARHEWRASLASWAAEHIDLDALLELANEAVGVPMRGTPVRADARVRIGLAHDDAFHFYYPDNLDLLREAGAELVPFSPLNDGALPEKLDGVIIGGGYPEAHAEALTANTGMRTSIKAFADSGRPVYAECGGLMYLSRRLQTADGETHDMVGALPLMTAMEPKLRSLGYREVTTHQATLLGPAGTSFRGHEFHYSALVDPDACATAYTWTGRRGSGTCGYTVGNVLASYVHAHWGSNPAIASNIVDACSVVEGAPG